MSEPRKRKWSLAFEADVDMDESFLRSVLDAPGIDIVSLEEIEPISGEAYAEPDCPDDSHPHCRDCGACEKTSQCICYAR